MGKVEMMTMTHTDWSVNRRASSRRAGMSYGKKYLHRTSTRVKIPGPHRTSSSLMDYYHNRLPYWP